MLILLFSYFLKYDTYSGLMRIKDACLRVIGPCLQIMIQYSTLNKVSMCYLIHFPCSSTSTSKIYTIGLVLQ
jgi:hypothetical protein